MNLTGLRAEVQRLGVENTRLLRLLQLTPTQAQPPGPAQTAIFESAPGCVHAGSTPAEKVALYATLFAARTDAYAVRCDDTRSGAAATADCWKVEHLRGQLNAYRARA